VGGVVARVLRFPKDATAGYWLRACPTPPEPQPIRLATSYTRHGPLASCSSLLWQSTRTPAAGILQCTTPWCINLFLDRAPEA
jgi:hypothetical protein